MEEGGVSRRWSLKPVSPEQGVALPDVRAFTPAVKTTRSLESLRLVSVDCGEKGRYTFDRVINPGSSLSLPRDNFTESIPCQAVVVVVAVLGPEAGASLSKPCLPWAQSEECRTRLPSGRNTCASAGLERSTKATEKQIQGC